MTNKMSHIQKITFSALCVAITVILVRFISVIDIPAIPFVRISFGPTFIVFSSMIVGPIYGGIIGLLSDVVGFFLFNRSVLGYNPLFSLVNVLYGVIPGLLMLLSAKMSKNKIPFIQITVLSILSIIITCFCFMVSSFTMYGKEYVLTFNSRMIILGITYAIVLVYFGIYFYATLFKYRGNEEKIIAFNIISSNILVTLFVSQLVVNVLIKMFVFEMDFFVIFGTQAISTCLETALGTYFIIPLYLIVKKKLNVWFYRLFVFIDCRFCKKSI